MWIWFIVVLCLLLLAAGLLFAHITTTVNINGEGSHWTMGYTSRYLGWRSVHSWQVPMTPAQAASPATGFDPRAVHKGISAMRLFLRFIRTLWSRTTVTAFQCAIHLGVGDAASTAMIVGSLNNFLGPWVSLRIAPRTEGRPEYGIYPAWDRAKVACEFHTTLKFRPIDISSALFAAAYSFVRSRQG